VKPFLMLRAAELAAERPTGSVEDVHFTEALAASVIEDTSSAGDTVLDPFAGYGTTLAVAARLGRVAIGVELLDERVALIEARTAGRATVLHGDARDLSGLVEGVLDRPVGSVDLVLTSPPYMTDVHHPANPLTGYTTDDGVYATYLQELENVFAQVASLLRVGGHAVLNVANLVTGDVVTPLAWDVGRVVSAHLAFRGETFLCWDEHPPGHAGDYLLWFQRT